MKLFNGDCNEVLKELEHQGIKVDGVITSPPYNTSRVGRSDKATTRYGEYKDNMENDDYISWQVELFNRLDRVIKKDGVILYNISYSSENTDTMWLLIADIIRSTPFTTADQIVWKKKSALPNNTSSNKLTRITENIFVFVRKKELKTFHMNKKVVKIREKTGQKYYENTFNFIEAKNNDKGYWNKVHKGTYSIDLCSQLLNRYFVSNSIILDPFSGVGTTGVACKVNNMDYIGIELDKQFHDIAADRIKNV